MYPVHNSTINFVDRVDIWRYIELSDFVLVLRATF